MKRGLLLAGLALSLLTACGSSGHATKSSRSADAKASPPVRTTTAGSPSSPPPSRELIALRTAITRALAKAGPDIGAFVYDLSARTELFALHAQVKRPPASVEKLYTTVALLRELGPSASLQTTVLGAGHLGPGGVWHGDLYLRGGGDPTFGDGAFNRVWEQGYGPTSVELVHELSTAGIKRVTGFVIADPWLFALSPGGPATGYAPDVPDYGGELGALTYDHGSVSRQLGPATFAVHELVLTMRGAHIRARASTQIARTPASAVTLASLSSPPMSVLLKLMDVPSDDLFAELLTMQLGARLAGHGNISTGASEIASVINGYDLHPRIVDGSGLSRSDQSSPREIVDLLRAVWRTPLGKTLWGSLPVVGVNGTVQRLAAHSPAQGRCVAKTGTLDYVTNLAGVCHTEGGHEVAFALLLDGPENSVADRMLGSIVAAIARY
ncbi:MAG: D-alanyl-D-alanine carboxypeptidase [Actinomycetota bacterium]|nr:D-alanyl-D-alanine carboxypeptidase [Actinomycetota bacterium]